MAEKRKKYLKKLDSGKRKQLQKYISQIEKWNTNNLDIVTLEWFDNYYRCRVWWFRIIYHKQENKNKIIKIKPRGDVYK